MILGHSGLDQERCGEAAHVVRDLANVFLDTSQTPDNPEAVYVASTRTVPGRVVFGSDAPVISPEVNLAKLRVAMDYFGLEESMARAIVRGNAQRLLAGAPNVRL
jgi:predicted TIM-barrel fold metal-dependent hydrolase